MARVFSGIKPTGPVTLGNYLGALRHWVTDQHEFDALYCVVDLHALTVAHDPAELRALTLELFRSLMAVGLDPDVCTLFVQSHVHEHTELSWLLECTVSFGELRRMTQFKEKAADHEVVSAGLFTYPVLMAADILLYDVDRVPVGDDQRQHLELARDVAVRFNGRYGDTFVVPEASIPTVGARIKDLQNPRKKMSKTEESPQGTILLLEAPDSVARKIKRAVTDPGNEVVYDPDEKPGVSNLLELLGAATGRSPEAAATGYTQYGPLKADTADAVIEMLRPIRERYTELASDPTGTAALLEKGAAKAQGIAAETLERAQRNLGLVPRAVKRALIVALFAFGYPVAIVVIARFVPVVRQRRIRWFAAHEAAVSAIVAGHALRPDAQGVVVNSAWLVAGTAWYALGGRRPSSPS